MNIKKLEALYSWNHTDLETITKIVELIADKLSNIDQRLKKLERCHENSSDHANFIFDGSCDERIDN
jgi:DNA-binding transcriptional MerR regulator